MSDQISELLGIVRDEIRLYRDLTDHARQKTALLKQGCVEDILESNKTEEAFNDKLRALESEMVRLGRDLSHAFRIPREEFTLMRLAQSLEPSLALEIQSQAFLFRNIIKHLKAVNQRNMRLIEQSIRYSGGVLALISNARGSYKPTGLFEQVPNIQPRFSRSA
mgnify:CR=1 FL=1